MKKLLLLLLILAAGSTLHAQTTFVDSIKVGNTWRSFRVHLPANLGTNRPLILNFHGLGSTADQQYFYTNFTAVADTAKFLLVYPQGLSALGTTYWNAGLPATQATGTDDVAFAAQLIDTMQARYGTNPDRTYSCGFSLGGYMSYYLACKLTSRFAAIASVAGTMHPDVYNGNCTPSRAIPTLQFHGTDDATVPYGGSTDGIHIDTLNAFWLRHNQCTAPPVVTAVPNTNTADNSTVTKYVWPAGGTAATTEFFKIDNGGHTWPLASIPLPGLVTNGDIAASVEIWRFFNRYTKTALAVTQAVSAGSETLKPAPNPARDYVELNTAGTTRIYDLAGRLLLQTAERRVDVRGLATGVYILELRAGGVVSRAQLVKE